MSKKPQEKLVPVEKALSGMAPPPMENNVRWQSLLRGQVTVATIGKFMTVVKLADQKAQVMIFLNSILIPVCISALEHEIYRTTSIVAIATAVLSIVAAIICIYPKRRKRHPQDPNFNLLHFNDISQLERDEYIERFLPIFNDPSKLAEAAVYDLYDMSRHSIQPKFVWLKLSYAIFALGNMIAIVCSLF